MKKTNLDALIEIVSLDMEPEKKISSLLNNLSSIWGEYSLQLLKLTKNQEQVFDMKKNRWETTSKKLILPEETEKMKQVMNDFYENGNLTLKDLFEEEYLLTKGLRFIHPVYPTKYNEMIFLLGEKTKENTSWNEISQICKTVSLGLGFIYDEMETKNILSEMKTLAEELEEAYKKLPQQKVRTKLKTDIKKQEIEEVCPIAFVGCMDEEIGPRFVETHPPEFNTVENLIMVVSSYTSIDFEQVSKIGHVFSTSSVLRPAKGELMGLYFVIPNEKARGGYELHSIHLLISQPYENAMVFGSLEVRGFLFQAREEYLEAYEKLRKSIITDNPSENELKKFEERIRNILYNLKKDVASFILGVIQQE